MPAATASYDARPAQCCAGEGAAHDRRSHSGDRPCETQLPGLRYSPRRAALFYRVVSRVKVETFLREQALCMFEMEAYIVEAIGK